MAKVEGIIPNEELLGLIRSGCPMYNLSGVVKSLVSRCLNSETAEPEIPTLQGTLADNAGYREYLLRWYNEKVLGANKGIEVEDSIKIVQSALLQDVFFVWDSVKDTYVLATMNTDLFEKGSLTAKVLKGIVEKNNKGICKANRIDIEYSIDGSTVKYKLVAARDFDIDDYKDDYSEDKRFFLVPFVYIDYYFIALSKVLLGSECNIKVTQEIGNFQKVRYISSDTKALEEYSDGMKAERSVSDMIKLYPLRGYFYAPSVGAPSTTAGVTKVNLFRTLELRKVSTESLKGCVEKPLSPFFDMVLESEIWSYLNSEDTEFNGIESKLKVLPRNSNCEILNEKNFSKPLLSWYIHSLRNAEKEQLAKDLGVYDKIMSKGTMYSSYREMGKDDIANFSSVVRKNLCRVTIRKKDGSLSSFMCTNSDKILRSFYGDGYVAKFESFGVRFSKMLKALDTLSDEKGTSVSPEDISKVLTKYGFSAEDTSIAEAKKYVSSRALGLSGSSERSLKVFFAEKSGVNIERSDSSSRPSTSVLVRGVEAYIGEKGVSEYYKNVDPRVIVSGIVFE